MTTVKTKPFDPAEYLDTPDAVAAYLTDALGVIARARGMTEVAREAGVSRESLYRALSAEGNPEFGTVMRVAQALGLRVSFTLAPQKAA